MSYTSTPDAPRGLPDRRAQPPAFRSEGEAQIGRCLDRHGIAYLHEHPLAVVDANMVRLWYPDFQLPHHGLVVEYGGRLDDPCYAEGWQHKHEVYRTNGIDALMLTPNDLRGDWPRHLLDSIDGVMADRLARFRDVRARASRPAYYQVRAKR